jgi:hypothetical protein
MKLKQIRCEITLEEARKHEQYRKIPDHILQSIFLYVHEGRHPGHFLSAVLCNDLFEAVGRADKEALVSLPELVIFIHNRVPTCAYKIHGVPGPKAMNRWVKWHRDQVEEIDTDQEE